MDRADHAAEQNTWNDVDDYVTGLLHSPDIGLERAIAISDQYGLPSIQVSATLGKLLNLLAQISRAHRILEIGTLGGYSTIWLARALPQDGRLITIELEPRNARVARSAIDTAGLADRVDLRIGAAVDVLPEIESESVAPFDMVFIDADKENGAAYLEWAVKLSRTGSLIVIDNVVRAGAITEENSDDPKVIGSRAALDCLGAHPEIDSTVIQTVGAKGYDGFAIAVVERLP